MKRIKKTVCLLLIFILILPLAGCWNYRGLNEMSIIFGAAIDRDSDNGNIIMTFEILNILDSGQESIKTKLVESEGETLFDAVRNARNTLSNKLYFGNMMIVIISKEIAQNENLSNMIDMFLKDAECRETINIVIAESNTAGELLKTKGNDNNIIGQEIEEIVKENNKNTSTTVNITLYKIYNILQSQGRSLVLPLFINSTDTINEEKYVKSNGVAVYKDQRMIGSLSSSETKNLLFVLDDVNGGVLTFASEDNSQDDSSLEISKNRTNLSYTNENNTIQFTVSTETDVYLNEIWQQYDMLDENKIAELEQRAERVLEQNISATIKKVQTQYDSDIFGFGNTIYKRDIKLWNKIKEQWPEIFKTMNVEVKSKINIINTAKSLK